MTDLISSDRKAYPEKRANSPVLLRGLRRRWKIGVIAFALGFCGGIFFAGPALALTFGLVFGLCLPLFLEYLDQTIKSVDDVRVKLGLTVLATLPRFTPGDGGVGQMAQSLAPALSLGPPDRTAYSRLCSSLRSLGGGEEPMVVMVTSCIPGEGKSTVSANLAVSLAAAGAKVLLVGCDLRRPALSELFGETHHPGLSELLAGEDNSGLRKLSHLAIDFMPAGEVPPYPADLLESESMREYLAFVKEQYDYVVLDAPPVLPVTDSKLLAPLCDLRLMVLEPCRIPQKMAVLLIKALREVGTRIDGVVLNDRSGRAAVHYGGSGEYGRDEETLPGRGSGNLSPAGKWLTVGALLLAVVIAGLSWQVFRNGEAPSESKSNLAAIAPRIPGKGRVVTATDVPPWTPPAPTEQPPVLVTPVSQEPPVPLSTVVEVKPEQVPPVALLVSSEPVAATATPVVAERKTVKTTAKPVVTPAKKPVAIPAVKPTAKPAMKPMIKPSTGKFPPALVALADSWQRSLPDSMVSDNVDIKGQLQAMGLLVSVLDTNLSSPLQCGTPLLLETRQEETGTAWITVIGRKGYKWQVSPQTRQGELLSEVELKRIWTGKGYLPWQDPLHLAALGAGVDDPERTAKLQQLLAKAGYLRQFETGIYGRETLKAIGHLQAASGLAVNGKLTVETLVLLYQADPAFKTPKFSLW